MIGVKNMQYIRLGDLKTVLNNCSNDDNYLVNKNKLGVLMDNFSESWFVEDGIMDKCHDSKTPIGSSWHW